MKNIFKLLAVFMVMSIAFVSCEKDTSEFLPQDEEFVLKSGSVTEKGVVPVLWTSGPGGNATCEDTGVENLVYSSERVSYENGVWMLDGVEYTEFPFEGVTVSVTNGRFLSWEFESAPVYDEDADAYFVYVIGAVIVKGGPAAHIYTYNGEESYGWNGEEYVLWTSSDSGLHSPVVARGRTQNIAGLSNLTFCVVERVYIPEPEEETEWKFPEWTQDISHIVLVFDDCYSIKIDEFPGGYKVLNVLMDDILAYISGYTAENLLGVVIKGGNQPAQYFDINLIGNDGMYQSVDLPENCVGFTLGQNIGNPNTIDETIQFGSIF